MAMDRSYEPLSWRDAPYSDWAVALTNSDDSSETIFRVHKAILAVGPRRSVYFAGVFDSQLQEHSDSTSRIILDGLVAPYFPLLLDFIYGKTITLTKDNAFEVKHLADYFGCTALTTHIRTFFEEDFPSHAPYYLKKALELGDKEIEDRARAYLIEHIEDVHDDAFNEFPAELFRSIIFSPVLLSPKNSAKESRSNKLRRAWLSYFTANPQFKDCLSSVRHSQYVNFFLGDFLTSFQTTQPQKELIRATRESTTKFMPLFRDEWQTLVLGDYLEIDETMNPSITFLANWLDQAQTDYADVTSERDELENENSKLEAERDALENENSKLVSERDELKDENSDLVWERDELKNENSELVSERDELENENSKLVSERDELEDKNSDLAWERDELKNENSELVSERDELQKEYDSIVSEKDEELERLQERVQELESKLDSTRDAGRDAKRARLS